MYFCLKNAAGPFQHVMDIIMSSVERQTALVYLDYKVIFSQATREHINRTLPVLRALDVAGVTLELKNCVFCTNKKDELGLVIRSCWLGVNNYTTDAIRDLKIPTAEAELCSFIWFLQCISPFYFEFRSHGIPFTASPHRSQAEALGGMDKE